MKPGLLIFAILLPFMSVSGQTTNVYIYDSNGNQTTGSISRSGSLYFYDNTGNVAFGSIKNGNVYLNGSDGQVIFGTIRHGDVFLTDSHGVTTGTIRDGNIFLSNTNGDVTYGHYDANGNVMVTSSGVPPDLASHGAAPSPCDVDCRSQQNYEAGYAMGTALGLGVRRLMHRLSVRQEGLYTISRKEEIVSEDETGFALACTKKEPKKCRMVKAPLPVRTYLLMEALRDQLATANSPGTPPGWNSPDNPFLQASRSSWVDMRNMYCRYAKEGLEPSMSYTNLDGNVEDCRSLQ